MVLCLGAAAVCLKASRSRKFTVRPTTCQSSWARVTLVSMVGAGRFERPTPCAQGGFRLPCKIAHFQRLLFQVDEAGLLRSVECYGSSWLSAATISSTTTNSELAAGFNVKDSIIGLPSAVPGPSRCQQVSIDLM